MKWLALALSLLCAPASAQEMVIGSGVVGIPKPTTAAYTGPGDLVTFTFYAGLRALNAAIVSAGTQKLVNLRNTGTNEQCDSIVSASGGLGLTANCTGSSNGQVPATFCSGGCATTKAYDQTGGGRDVSQATAASQTPIIFSGCGVIPNNCWQWSSSVSLASSGTFTPASGVVSIFAVADRVSANAATAHIWIRQNGVNNRFTSINSAGTGWSLIGGGGGTLTSSNGAINTWHASTGVINGASSVVNLDGTETTGTITGNTTAGVISITALPTGTPTGMEVEAGFIDASAVSGSIRTSLCQNAQSYWGSANFGAVC